MDGVGGRYCGWFLCLLLSTEGGKEEQKAEAFSLQGVCECVCVVYTQEFTHTQAHTFLTLEMLEELK